MGQWCTSICCGWNVYYNNKDLKIMFFRCLLWSRRLIILHALFIYFFILPSIFSSVCPSCGTWVLWLFVYIRLTFLHHSSKSDIFGPMKMNGKVYLNRITPIPLWLLLLPNTLCYRQSNFNQDRRLWATKIMFISYHFSDITVLVSYFILGGEDFKKNCSEIF